MGVINSDPFKKWCLKRPNFLGRGVLLKNFKLFKHAVLSQLKRLDTGPKEVY
jgi:hypothetical protein